MIRYYARISLQNGGTLTESEYWRGKKILVTGGTGFLGSHLVDNLTGRRGVNRDQLILPTHKEDLRYIEQCKALTHNVEVVIHLAAKVGGIGYNQKNPGSLFYDNTLMGLNIIESARQAGVKKFVQVGTVCAYPKHAKVPFKEDDLWNGYPEETNAPYGIAKKSLLVMAQAYRQQYGMNIIYLLPVNLYGPRDNFDPESSHVIPALIRKTVQAKDANDPKIRVWGTGKASREFLYVEDAAEAIVLATEKYDKADPVNLGTGEEITIRNLVKLIVREVGFTGSIEWDSTRPDGQPRRKLDTTKAKREFEFTAKTNLASGIRKTVEWYTSGKTAN